MPPSPVFAADTAAQDNYAFILRMVVAVSVGAAIVLGMLRILKGWPIHRLIAIASLTPMVFVLAYRIVV